MCPVRGLATILSISVMTRSHIRRYIHQFYLTDWGYIRGGDAIPPNYVHREDRQGKNKGRRAYPNRPNAAGYRLPDGTKMTETQLTNIYSEASSKDGSASKFNSRPVLVDAFLFLQATLTVIFVQMLDLISMFAKEGSCTWK